MARKKVEVRIVAPQNNGEAEALVVTAWFKLPAGAQASQLVHIIREDERTHQSLSREAFGWSIDVAYPSTIRVEICVDLEGAMRRFDEKLLTVRDIVAHMLDVLQSTIG